MCVAIATIHLAITLIRVLQRFLSLSLSLSCQICPWDDYSSSVEFIHWSHSEEDSPRKVSSRGTCNTMLARLAAGELVTVVQ